MPLSVLQSTLRESYVRFDEMSEQTSHKETKMQFLKKKVVQGIIDAFDDGTIFSVVFQKADGTLRRMVCRTGVKAHLKGGEATYNANPDNIGVFDTEKGEYRCFNGHRVLRIKGGGATIQGCDMGEIELPIHDATGKEITIR